MTACPNHNDPSWKLLVKQVGEDLANLAFVSNGYRVPDVKPLSEIKKAIGFKSEVTNYAGIASKLIRYNQLNGTSHSFTPTLIYGNTFKLTFHPNYLSVNVEKQRQRMEARNPVLRVENLQDYKKGLNNLYPYTPSPSEQAAGRFNQEGDFIPNDDYIDELVDTAAFKVESVESKRKQKIDKEILKIQDLLRNTEDAVQVRDLHGKLKKLKDRREKSEVRIAVSEKINSFEEVLKFADKQLEEVDKILNKDTITFEDIDYARRVINLWKKAGDFSMPADQHIILDASEFNTKEIRLDFKNRQNKAENFSRILTQIEEDYLVQFVREHTSQNLDKAEIFKILKDANKMATLTKNLSRHDDAMLQAIFSSVEKANILAQQEANEVWKDLDQLTSKVLKKTGNNYNIFKQVTEDNKPTGRVVSRFSPEFYDIRNHLINKAFNQFDSNKQKKKDKIAVNDYFNWINANTITFDPRALFPDSKEADSIIPDEFIYNRVTFDEAAKNKHIQELKTQLGEKGYEYYLGRLQKKLEEFKVLRENIYFSIQAEAGLSEEGKKVLFEEWLKEHSPYWGIDMNENPASRKKGENSFYSPKGIIEHGIQVPRRFINNQETKWYDKNFEKIEADEDLLAYHSLIMKTLNQMRIILPPSQRKLMGVGVVPTISKDIIDIFSEKGLAMGIIPFMDKMKQLQTTTDLSTNITGDVDLITGEIEKELTVAYIEDTNAKVNELVRTMKIKHEQNTGRIATAEEIKEFKKEARSIIANQKSWDLTKILKAYSLATLAYKHKAFIEPQIKLAERVFKAREEVITNEAGIAKTKDGEVATKQGLKNYIAALEFFLDSTYYGKGARKIEGVTKTKLYTSEETKRKKELEELLANETDDTKKEFLQNQIDALGGYRTGSGSFDAVLKFMTFKGLGWNIPSAFSNMGFGAISNLIQASDGREYSMENLRKAYILVSNSVGRNLSMNTLFNSTNGNAVKIRNIMDKGDFLKTSNQELYDTSQKSSLNKLKRFGPYTLQERSEYVNYAPVMIAVMLEFKAKDSNGNEVTYWDALDSEGNLKEGYTSDVDPIKLNQKIRRVIEMNHGDYNNALQIKATALGRAVSQFRTWMFEGFANRFENEKVDYALSYGLDEPYIRKGRYKSYTAGQLSVTAATVGTIFLPGIGTAIGAGAGYLGGKFFGMQTEENVISDVLFTLKQLARKLMFQKTQFGDKFNATDAANMRKNMTELYILVGLAGIALMLKAMIDDDDDEDKAFVGKFLINQVVRLQTDITFYTNPLEFDKLTKTAVPLMQLLDDIKTIFVDAGAYLNDDSEDEIFEGGPFKGDSKFWVHLGEALPGSAQGIRLYRTGTRVIE